MIKKIMAIKNTSKFRSFTSRGDLQFKKWNLIYAENGRGKTTLSQILRSLKEQNDAIVKGRRTVDGLGDQSIDILFDTQKVVFSGSKRQNKPSCEIEIFDSVFVSDNVFSGNIVEHDHKKQFYLFTIGAEGVEFADQLAKLEEDIKDQYVAKRPDNARFKWSRGS